MNQAHCNTHTLLRGWPTVLLLALFLAACSGGSPAETVAALPATPIAIAATPTPVAAAEATVLPAPTPNNATSAPVAAAPVAATTTITPTEPIAADSASAPTRIRIPAQGLDAVVSPMGWRVVDVGGQRMTVWELPEVGVGWHPNSAGAGSVGNVVISGHQLLGDGSFAVLALGDAAVGQDVLVTDSDGRTFAYRVTAVSEPQPISTDSAAEKALDAQYTAQGKTASLTLITGWPDYSSTHRIFVTAEFVGVAE